jgi:hypothetical protein
MSINLAPEDFEKYRLDVEIRDEGTVRLVRDSFGGANTWQTWTRRRSLGQGAFGEVCQEMWEDKHGDLHYRAVKTCSERKMRAARVDYKRELSALAAFSKSEVKKILISIPSELTNHSILVCLSTYMDGGWTQGTFSSPWNISDTVIYPSTLAPSSRKWRSKRSPTTFCEAFKSCMRKASRIVI